MVNSLHPALAFLQQRMRTAQPVGPDTLRWDIDGAQAEIFVSANTGPVFFAAGETRLSYRCSAGLPDLARERLRATLLDLRDYLAAGRVGEPHDALPEHGGWTDRVLGGELPAWRDWVTRSYRAAIDAGRPVECSGLPDCLDLRMRPPIQPQWLELADAPQSGPCSQCGRAPGCPDARKSKSAGGLKPLRHADAATAEIAALRTLASASSVPLPDAMDAYSSLHTACGDGTLHGALPLEYSARVTAGQRQPDRLRFVSYYPLVTNDAVRREINRGRRAAVRKLAARWLSLREATLLDAWLQCTTDTQPGTLGLSIGLEIDAVGIRIQVYAHPEPGDAAQRFVDAAVTTLAGSSESLPAPGSIPVLVSVAVSANRLPALKIYYHRRWNARHDTGLLPDGLGELGSFNPGWGLAVQEHIDGRAEWVKWDFPVTTHYQAYDRFLAAFWRASDDRQESVPVWLSGDSFSVWPTWASVGRGGRTLYFVAR